MDIEKEEIHHFFPEMRKLMNDCKFNNCVHVNEPNCAVKQAVENDEISESRHQNYVSLFNEEDDNGFRANLYEPK